MLTDIKITVPKDWDNKTFDFCHVYKFTGASKTAKIKEITSYIIPEKE